MLNKDDLWLFEAHALVRETVARVASHMPSRYDSRRFVAFDKACANAIKRRHMPDLSRACVAYTMGS